MVELACLESMYTRKGIKGSNPFSSAQCEMAMCMVERYYAYVLQSLRDFSFYVGHCDDLDCRMSKHFDGWSKYTSGHGPWRLKYFEVFATRREAIRREKEIKAKKSRSYLQSLIDNWLRG